jgi:hypothetical protein
VSRVGGHSSVPSEKWPFVSCDRRMRVSPVWRTFALANVGIWFSEQREWLIHFAPRKLAESKR